MRQTHERMNSLDATFRDLEQHEDGATMHIDRLPELGIELVSVEPVGDPFDGGCVE